jgi:prepilin-type N-terminal cleavage/methylation domain-containing protein
MSVSVERARVHEGTTCPTRAGERGFTLVELLTVVVITGVLATLAFASLRAHVSAAWGAEALNMVQSIRAAEERWRSEHMMYLDVSTDERWYPRDPRTAPTSRQAFYYAPEDDSHVNHDEWLMLRPTAPGAVRFGYLVNAGPAETNMTDAADPGPAAVWPTPPKDNWYVIQAIGDPDGDGVVSYYRASSLDGEVFSVNHGE